ncbi:Hsp20/alpha crystallin family protein [Virgibacillus sp. W0181]|uniref:Hsp20/alpha crystallin family protein n=1 Tax=Virgibacillus sp. W0181 TaxID=3391581 RepID=UPI003F46107D
MKPIRRWKENNHPVNQLRNELGGAFQRFVDDPFFAGSLLNKEGDLYPPLNVEEKPDRYTIELEVPGILSQDIDIMVEGGILTIKGEKQKEETSEDKDRKMHVVERSYGSFQRSLTLADNANTEEIKAECQNGILYIDIPKNPNAETRRIEIKNKDNN